NTVQSLTVALTDVNDNAPVFTSSATPSVAENSTAVVTLAATDAEPVSFSITGGADAALFTITGGNQLAFIAARDYETQAHSYAVQVTASDGVPAHNTVQSLTVALTDVNDNAPVFTSSATPSVAENSTAVVTLAATDAEPVSFSITGGADAALFTITGGNQLAFIAARDYETQAHSYAVQVTASDGAPANNTVQSLTVSLTNVNDNAPVITSNGAGVAAAVSVAENSTAVTTVTATDADGALNPLTFSLVGGADAAKFAINGASGVLSFLSAPDFEAPTDAGSDNIYDVTVQVSDGTNIDTQAIAVTVTNVNENTNAPVFTSGNSVSTPENVATTTIVYDANATDANGDPITFSLSAGGDNDRFSINSSTGEVRFLASPNFEAPADTGANNVYDIVVHANDGGFDTAQAVAITVTDVNDNAPVYTSTATPSVAENSTAVVTLTTTDADTVGTNPATFSITGGADAALFTITAGNQLAFIAARDYETQAHIYAVQVTASDGVPAHNTVQSLTVALTDVNDNAPVFDSGAAASVAENSTAVV